MESLTQPFSAVFLPDIRSGWNTGAFFRTADSLGVNHVFLGGLTPYPPHTQISKTALSADTFVPWTYFQNPLDGIEFLKSKNITPIAMELTSDAKNIQKFNFPLRCCLIMGNEVSGIKKEILDHCKDTIYIPMQGQKQSMNVSIAGGIGMWEMMQR